MDTLAQLRPAPDNQNRGLQPTLTYYSRQVPLEHLDVIDHGSTDGSTSGLAGINVIRLDSSLLDEVWRAGLVSEVCGGLLSRYESVAYTDIDEILAADPRRWEQR